MKEDRKDNQCHEKCHCKHEGVSSEPKQELSPEQENIAEVKEHLETPSQELVATLKREAEENKDKYLRALAEMENSRKRLMRERVEAQGFAVQNVIMDFLPPFDQMELALQHAGNAAPEVKAWSMGFQMILDHFRQVFASHGVSSFSSVGELFDPHLHEAIETEETSEKPEGTILEEFQKGYRMGGKTIRPAKVKVATAPKAADVQEKQERQEEASSGE